MQSTSDMQRDLGEVAEIAKKIKELSVSLEETLNNRDKSLENTSEGIRSLIQDSATTFTTIIEKSRKAQATLKTKTKSNESPLLPLGTRVEEGPDNDDRVDIIRIGTVVGHNNNDQAYYLWPTETGDRKTVDVIWDYNNKRAKYYCNRPCQIMAMAQNKYDVGVIKRGCKVKRGRGWKKEKGDEDGGIDSIGIVFSYNKPTDRDLTDVYVCWPETKNIGLYRLEDEVVLADSSDGSKQDLPAYSMIYSRQEEEARSDDYHDDCHAIEYEPEMKPNSINDSNLPTLKGSNPSGTKRKVTHEPGIASKELKIQRPVKWSYQKGDSWIFFSADVTNKLEEGFQKSEKTSVILVDNKSYRVVFEKMRMNRCGLIAETYPVKQEQASDQESAGQQQSSDDQDSLNLENDEMEIQDSG